MTLFILQKIGFFLYREYFRKKKKNKKIIKFQIFYLNELAYFWNLKLSKF